MLKVCLCFLDGKSGVDAAVFPDEREKIIFKGVSRQFPRCDFRWWKFQVHEFETPRTPVQPTIKISPLIFVFGAMKAEEGINRQEMTTCAFSWDFDLSLDV